MNLGQIVTAVENELQYSVETVAHRTDYRARVNDVYQTLCRKRRWPWLYRRSPLWVLPDFTMPHGSVTMPFPVEGPRAFKINRQSLFAALGLPQQSVTEFLQLQIPNGQLDIIDRTKGDGNWERGPFVIESCVALSPDASIIGFPTLRFVLDPRASITSIDDTEGDWRFSFPRVQLPPECDALDCIRNEQGVPLRSVTPQEERFFLQSQTVPGGTAYYVLEDYGFEPNQNYYLQTVNAHGGASFESSPFLAQTENWPVEHAIQAITLNPTTGNILAGTKMRIFASWHYANRFGPPSNIVEFTVDDFLGVKVTNLPSLAQTTGTFEYGRRVAIFAAQNEGAFYFRGFLGSATATTYNITEPFYSNTAVDAGLRLPRWDDLYPGTYQYVRLSPRPSAVTRHTCEYWKRPRQLVQDTDTPEFREEFHRLIVWMTVEELVGGRYGGDPAFQRMQALRSQVERDMITRYFPKEQHRDRQKGMIGTRVLGTQALRGVDWNGDS